MEPGVANKQRCARQCAVAKPICQEQSSQIQSSQGEVA